MHKGVMLVALSLLIMLAACGNQEVTGRRVAIPDSSTPTAAAVAPPADGSSAETGTETGTTAAEMLADLKNGETLETTSSGEKSGNFYPPIAVTGTGKEALKEKTRALFNQPLYDPNVEVGELGDFNRDY